jgi:peptidoglycan/LPS O-acetylase OafA/YrhL
MSGHPPGDGKIAIVEIMRGLSALAVAWFHLTNGYNWDWVRDSGTYGWLGVDAFFAISGFVVPYSIHKRFPAYSLRDFPRFVARRTLRLEPPYIASILRVIALWNASAAVPTFPGGAPKFSVPQVAAHLFYAGPPTEYSWLQPVYRTLAYEFVFYLLIGAVFPLMSLKDRPYAWLALSAAVLL